MNPTQILSHQEQIEAAKEDFEIEYALRLYRALKALNVRIRPEDEPMVKHVLWLAFRSGARVDLGK